MPRWQEDTADRLRPPDGESPWAGLRGWIMGDSRRRWFVEPLALKLFGFVAVLVLGVLVPAGYLVTHQHYDSSLELKRQETERQDRVLAMALEHQMLENRRDLIRKLVEGFSSDPARKRLMILDHEGRVRLSNDAAFAGRVFARDSPTCQVCHAVPSPQRATSAVIPLSGGTALRSVYPLRNQQACHRCHDPANTINGVMITDTDLGDLRARLNSQIRVMWAGVVAIGLALLVGVTLIVRVLILGRLERIERTTRAATQGDFGQRVMVSGHDAVARLGSAFNAMGDSVTGLLSELRLQRTQLENVMNSVDDGLLVVDRTFSVVALNQALAQRIGEPREHVLYRGCSEIWGDECDCTRGGEDESCPARACFASGEVQRRVRTRHTREGALREEEVFASPILGAGGEVEQVVEVWRDITERKSREARMAEFQRLVSLGTLASGFSHEINTPLGTMLVHLDEVRRAAGSGRTPDGLASEAAQLEMIRGEILRCRDITHQFLQLSRGRSIRRELVDIPGIVGATLPLIAHLARDASVSLRVVEGEAAPVVLANTGAVQQVLLNILLNAVQASQPGGEVRVGWHRAPGGGDEPAGSATTWIRVEDDGAGMSPDVREQVFEPFFSRRASGTGLGLFVSLNLARQWNGDIRVTSEPGRGSVFLVGFPPAEGTCPATDC